MNKCSVYICESKTEYEGQYEFMNAGMEVEYLIIMLQVKKMLALEMRLSIRKSQL